MLYSTLLAVLFLAAAFYYCHLSANMLALRFKFDFMFLEVPEPNLDTPVFCRALSDIGEVLFEGEYVLIETRKMRKHLSFRFSDLLFTMASD